MMKNLYYFIWLLFLILAAGGCQHDPLNMSDELTSVSTRSLTPVDFNWENADYMPTPNGITILSPWAVNANQNFPSRYITDRFKADGWVLVYNTFNYVNFIEPAFFVLYNKFRGILRAYFYIAPTTPIPSSYVTHTLKLKGGMNTKLLNYSAVDRVYMDVLQDQANKIQKYQFSSTGGWYAEEFDVLYDPNIKNLNASNNLLEWDINSVNVTQLNIAGSSQGTIKGTIGAPASIPNYYESAVKGALYLTGLSELNALDFLGTTLKNSIKSALTSGLNGSIKNTFNGVFGITTGGQQAVSLKISADYQFTGTLEDNYLITSPSMAIPGTSIDSNFQGYIPLYNKPLGIFTIESQPIVTGTFRSGNDYYDDDEHGSGYEYVHDPRNDFYLDLDSYNIVFNPAVINNTETGAQIKNLKQEILGDSDLWPYSKRDGWGTAQETINTDPIFILPITAELEQEVKEKHHGETETAVHWYHDDNLKMKSEFLRISFDVVPNSGANKVTIAKTFYLKCNPTNEYK